MQRIRAWAKYFGDAAIEEMTLLQVRDEKTLNELLADPELAALIKPFAPAKTKALARVQEKDLDALRALLSERGIDLAEKLKLTSNTVALRAGFLRWPMHVGSSVDSAGAAQSQTVAP